MWRRAPVAAVTGLARSRLRAGLRAAAPHLSWRAQALVDAILLTEGAVGAAGCVARLLGLRNRFELAHWLAHEGLPPLHELAGWISVLVWVDLCALTGASLCALALCRDRDPAACYRLVQRVTGQSWSAVRALGGGWVLAGFATRCGTVRDGGWAALGLERDAARAQVGGRGPAHGCRA